MLKIEQAQQITEQCLTSLHPDFEPKARAWHADTLKRLGDKFYPYIYCGYRSPEVQDELYSHGRTTGGSIVTKARAWQSYHQYGMAFDFVPLCKHSDPKLAAQGFYESNWDADDLYKLSWTNIDRFYLMSLFWETPHLQANWYDNWQELNALMKSGKLQLKQWVQKSDQSKPKSVSPSASAATSSVQKIISNPTKSVKPKRPPYASK